MNSFLHADPQLYFSRLSRIMKDAGSIVSMDAGLSLDEQARGLDWVHWLLRGVRQQCEGVVLERQDVKERMHAQWRAYASGQFERGLGAVLLEAWRACTDRKPELLLELEMAWAGLLSNEQKDRSALAGSVLLKRTRGASYQGTLGHLREQVQEGTALGHIGVVWPAIAHLFQLTPTVMLSEYLRLEWETAVRDLHGIAAPVGSVSIVKVAERVMRRGHEASHSWRKTV